MTLRDLAMLRPPMRSIAMDILLGLATHSEKPIRGTAILTIKRWVPDVQPLGQMGVDFALQVLRRLESTASRQVSVSRQPSIAPVEGTPAVESAKPVNGEVKQDEDSKDEMQVDASPNTAATVKDGVIISGLEHARNEGEVAQHIELLFGLVSKAPELLDECVCCIWVNLVLTWLALDCSKRTRVCQLTFSRSYNSSAYRSSDLLDQIMRRSSPLLRAIPMAPRISSSRCLPFSQTRASYLLRWQPTFANWLRRKTCHLASWCRSSLNSTRPRSRSICLAFYLRSMANRLERTSYEACCRLSSRRRRKTSELHRPTRLERDNRTSSRRSSYWCCCICLRRK